MEIKKIMIIAMYFFIQLVLSACNPCESKYLGTYEFKIDSINFFNSSNYYYYDTFVAIDTIHENDYLSFSVILNIAATKIARNNNSFSFIVSCRAFPFRRPSLTS